MYFADFILFQMDKNDVYQALSCVVNEASLFILLFYRDLSEARSP